MGKGVKNLICGASAFMAAALLMQAVAVSVSASEDEFPEGMTDAEKSQMLDEMYSDIGEDAEFDPEDPDIRADFETEDDEELKEDILDNLPSVEEFEDMASDMSEQVMSLATYVRKYDSAKSLFRYVFEEGCGISMSTPLGSFSDHAVTLTPDEGVAIINASMDGAEVSVIPDEDGTYFFRETGNYAFIAYAEEGERRTYLSGSFHIVDPRVPVTYDFMWAPEGYRITDAMVDNVPLLIDDGRWLELSRDGVYRVTYSSKDQAAAFPDVEVMFSRDTTAPMIEWEGEVNDGVFVNDVSYSVPEKDAVVEMWYNGQPAISSTGVLASAGNYYVTVTDPVGNSRSYQFTLEKKMQIPWMFVGICGGFFLAVALILVVTAGRGMRVR